MATTTSYDRYGMNDFILNKRSYPPKTRLVLREAPKSGEDKQYNESREITSYHIPILSLRDRSTNKDEKFVLLGELDVMFLSYLEADIPYTWKNPEYHKYLKRDTVGDTKYATLGEAFEDDHNQEDVYIFSTFNMLPLSAFYDSSLKKWKIRNSEELMNAIQVDCMLRYLYDTHIFTKEDLFNPEENRKTVKGVHAGMVSVTNHANSGMYVDKETNQFVPGTPQTLPFQCEVEWYVDYFDNTIEGHELIKADNDGNLTRNKAWEAAYLLSQPKAYRNERRFVIKYRRYDPTRENRLITEYEEKISFANYYLLTFFNQKEWEAEYNTDNNFKTTSQVTNESRAVKNIITFVVLENPKYYCYEDYKKIGVRLDELVKEKRANYEKLSEDKQNKILYSDEKKKTLDKIFKNKDFSSILKNKEYTQEINQVISNVPIFNRSAMEYAGILGRVKIDDLQIGENAKNMISLRRFYFWMNDVRKQITKELLKERDRKLHLLRSRIFATARNTARPGETSWLWLKFKEVSKGPI
jgi:hypothetical protein